MGGDVRRRGDNRKHAATKPAQGSALRTHLIGGVETPPFHCKNPGDRRVLVAQTPLSVGAP